MALENLDTDAVDPHFWANPPWADGRGKYRMGLAPIELDQWLSRPIQNPLRLHKQTLLTNRYASVVATTSYSQNAQATLAEQMQVSARDYPDSIADCALSVADDLCLIESSGAQRLLAGCVCSPSYWDLRSKIGHPLQTIHEPVTTLNAKIGDGIQRFIANAPVMRPFERSNWLIHGDNKRLHLRSESLPTSDPAHWWIRSERETLCRLDNDYMLFSINVRFQRLAYVAQYDAAREAMIEALINFDQAETDYFGGAEKVFVLSNYLKNAGERF